MLAAYPIRMVSQILQDKTHVLWTLNDLIDALNAATYALASIRPDSKSTIVAVTLAAGTKQAIPTGGVRLLNITRNMGVNGTTPGKAVTLAQINSFNLTRPGWHTDKTSTVVRHFLFDNRAPKDFYVWPPVPATPVVQVEMVYSGEPTLIPLTTDAPAYDPLTQQLDVSGTFVNPLLEFMLFRAYMKDGKTKNEMLANQHLQQFYSFLGFDSQKAAIHSQENRDRPYSGMVTQSVEV